MEGLTETDVATLLQCTKRHVRRLRAEGMLRADKIEGKFRFFRPDVVDYMEKRLEPDMFIPVPEAARRANVPVTTLYSAVTFCRIRNKRAGRTKKRVFVFWPDCESLYVKCALKNRETQRVPRIEELFDILESGSLRGD